MPQKTYGTPVPFADYAWKNMNDLIARGLTFGVTATQPTVFTVVDSQLSAFTNGAMSELAGAITTYAGMTLKYARISWNETYVGTDEYGAGLYEIRDMNLGFVVHVDTTGNGNSILNAIDYPDWFHNCTMYIPAESWSAYLLDPCPTGTHWDEVAGQCVHDVCQTGFHWDVATQTCVKDTSTNCLLGSHWDETQGKCVLDSTDQGGNNGQSFPWIYVLLGLAGITAAGGIVYYLVKRKKKRSQPQNTIETVLE